MKAPPAFLFYAKDWLVDTARFPLEAQGAYLRLLAHEWVEGPLPRDHGTLARIIGLTPAKFRTIWRHIGNRFVSGGEGTLKNPRLEAERQKQDAYRTDQAERGRHGARKRWAMAEGKTDAIANAMPQVEAQAQPDDGIAVAFAVPEPTFSERRSRASRERTSPTPTRIAAAETSRVIGP